MLRRKEAGANAERKEKGRKQEGGGKKEEGTRMEAMKEETRNGKRDE